MKHLREFATVRDHEILDAIEQFGNQTAAAKELGINRRSLERALQRLKIRAARRGLPTARGGAHS